MCQNLTFYREIYRRCRAYLSVHPYNRSGPDYTYDAEHFVQGGEMLLYLTLQICTGGKGLNQSVAAGRIGSWVWKNLYFALWGGVNQTVTAEQAMREAAAASAIAVSRPGAAPSIPTYAEVEAFLRSR